MARRPRFRLSRRAGLTKVRFEESKHRRDPTGKFADKPGAGDDEPLRPRRGPAQPGSQRAQLAAARVKPGPKSSPSTAPPRPAPAAGAAGVPKVKAPTTKEYTAWADKTRSAPLTQGEVKLIKQYTDVNSGMPYQINGQLRLGEAFEPRPPAPVLEALADNPEALRGAYEFARSGAQKNLENTAVLDAIAAKSALPDGVTLYRGVSDESFLTGLKPGDTLLDRGYMSTSLDPTVARGFGGTQYMMEIRAAKGSRVIVPGRESLAKAEKEVMLARDARLRMIERLEERGTIRYVFEYID